MPTARQSSLFDPAYSVAAVAPPEPAQRPKAGSLTWAMTISTELTSRPSTEADPAGSTPTEGQHGAGDGGDDALASRFGLLNHFRRDFGPLETFSFAMTIISVSSCVAFTLDTPLLLAGPASVVWCWLAGSVFSLTIALSLAELMSAYPTAGGLYFAASSLVPARHQALTGWVCGWLNNLGQLSAVASTELAVAAMVWAGVSAAKEEDVNVTPAMTFGLFAAFLGLHGALNSLRTAHLAVVTRAFIFVNVGIAILIPLLLVFLTPLGLMQPPSVVFTQIDNQTGYSNSLAFLFGLVAVQWTMIDYDAVAHISLEVRQAAISAPAALITAVAATGALGFLMNVALMFAAPDMEHLPGHSGMSFLTILILRTGKPCGLLLWAIVCSVAFFVVHVTLHSCSRSVFAFAKDGALPFSPFLARLSPATRTPLMAVWFSVGCCLLLGALNFISSEAGNAIVAMCPVALDVSYAIAVLCRRIWANHPDVQYRPGPFALPEPWSLLCNLMALCWIAFVCVILCWPTVHDFTAKTFNWSGVIVFGILAVSLAWYAVSARHRYVGPRRDVAPQPLAAAGFKHAGRRAKDGGTTHASAFGVGTRFDPAELGMQTRIDKRTLAEEKYQHESSSGHAASVHDGGGSGLRSRLGSLAFRARLASVGTEEAVLGSFAEKG